ncbi:MAG: hypothetical protein WC755_09280, partial [Candidatus Woesearchaeota archaeon]
MEIIDVHVHFGAPKTTDCEGNVLCYWSQGFEDQIAYYAMLAITGSLFKKVSYELVKDHIFSVINKSIKTDKFVLLALDQVYDDKGQAQPDQTHLHTSNDLIIKLKNEYVEKFNDNRILFGCSIHPNRKDKKQELERCIKAGAVLCKWIPSSMQINP